MVERFWLLLGGQRSRQTLAAPTDKQKRDLLSGAAQILAVEAPAFRRSLVDQYRSVAGTRVTELFVRLALYDLDSAVRHAAVEALRQRPKEEYTDLLLAGLHCPWAPAARNAAKALVTLKRKDLVTRLHETLTAVDAPGTDQAAEQKGSVLVRELVRINHHRNCLLCHEPAPALDRTARRSLPVGPVPSPAERLPPLSSALYNEPDQGRTLVRADVTYLRQDFSVLLPVEDAQPWPRMYRYDFLVRTRLVKASDRKALDRQEMVALAQRRAIGWAIERLTVAAGDADVHSTLRPAPGRVGCTR